MQLHAIQRDIKERFLDAVRVLHSLLRNASISHKGPIVGWNVLSGKTPLVVIASCIFTDCDQYHRTDMDTLLPVHLVAQSYTLSLLAVIMYASLFHQGNPALS